MKLKLLIIVFDQSVVVFPSVVAFFIVYRLSFIRVISYKDESYLTSLLLEEII